VRVIPIAVEGRDPPVAVREPAKAEKPTVPWLNSTDRIIPIHLETVVPVKHEPVRNSYQPPTPQQPQPVQHPPWRTQSSTGSHAASPSANQSNNNPMASILDE